MRFLVINGPNLNLLGKREPAIYGSNSYKALVQAVHRAAAEAGVRVKTVQSNYEGKIVEIIQKAPGRYDGIIINPLRTRIRPSRFWMRSKRSVCRLWRCICPTFKAVKPSATIPTYPPRVCEPSPGKDLRDTGKRSAFWRTH